MDKSDEIDNFETLPAYEYQVHWLIDSINLNFI